MKKSIFGDLTLLVATSLLINPYTLFADARVDKAKEEQRIVIYGSTQLDHVNPVIERFKRKYPFLSVNYTRLASERLLSRILTESRAGAQVPDLLISTGGNLLTITEKGLLTRYNSPERKGINDSHKDKDGYWTGLYANLEFWGYNKKLVSLRTFREAARTFLIRDGREK